uniref:Ig-like domain-containing protein n=1 Tax=Mola mola TaxID=94237 RepID=A0A3Q3WS24_MOLML
MEILFQSVLILIAVLTSATGAEEVIYAQLGETITLKPPEGYKSHNYYLYWYFGDVELVWLNYLGGSSYIKDKEWMHFSLSNGSLKVTFIQQEQFGTFTCKLTWDGVKTETTYKIIKLSVNSSFVVLPGEPLPLVCDTETLHSPNKPEIHWLNPQEEIHSPSVTVNATNQHNGQWACVVTHDKKIHKAKISILVLDLSPAPLQPQYTSKSSPLTIPCSISSHISWEQIKAKGIQEGHWQFFQKPSSCLKSVDPQRLFQLSLKKPVSWSKEGEDRGLTPVSGLEKGVLSLTKKQWKVEDRGDYVCTLKFNNGVTLNRTVHVDVLQISASPGIHLISGQQLNLTCSLSYPLSSDMSMKWIVPEQSSQQPVAFQQGSTYFTILRVDTNDGGNWACELWQRNKRLTAAVITLMIGENRKKGHDYDLVARPFFMTETFFYIMCLIMSFSIVYRTQQKMRRLRHRLCKCKNPKPKGFYRT